MLHWEPDSASVLERVEVLSKDLPIYLCELTGATGNKIMDKDNEGPIGWTQRTNDHA